MQIEGIFKNSDKTNESEKLERLNDNLDWFYSNCEHFKKYHKNQYVAIKDKRLLDKDTDLEILVKRLKIKDYADSILIEFVYG